MARQHAAQNGAQPVLGLIVIDSVISLLPGSPCNAANYGVPVEFCMVRGVTGNRCLAGDPEIGDLLIEAARTLEARSCTLIGANCGYLGRYQSKVANSVESSVFLSSLLILPTLDVVLKKSAKIGIVTYSAQALTSDLLKSSGWHGPQDRVVVAGIDHMPSWAVMNAPHATIDSDAMQNDLLQTARELVARESEIGALLFECTAMSVFAPHLSRHMHVPIFDYTALLKTMVGTLCVPRYRGTIAPPAAAGLRIAESVARNVYRKR